ncbi:hypothetical protein D3C75_845820 [compost metagenome]
MPEQVFPQAQHIGSSDERAAVCPSFYGNGVDVGGPGSVILHYVSHGRIAGERIQREISRVRHPAGLEDMLLHIIRKRNPGELLDEQTQQNISRVIVMESGAWCEFHRQFMEHRKEVLKLS